MRKKRIKFLPGLISYFPITFFLLISVLLISIGIILNSLENWLFVSVFFVIIVIIFLCVYGGYKNGFELYVKIKDNKICTCTIPFKYRKYSLNNEMFVYKTKVTLMGGQGWPMTVIVDSQTGNYNAFIVTLSKDFVDKDLVNKFHRNIDSMSDNEKMKFLGNILMNDKIIPIDGTKGNYNFLRQYLTKEQFCGLTENDNKDLEKYEKIYQRKLSKIKK